MSKAGRKKRHVASASTALLFGTILGLLQAATLIFAAKPLLAAMGLKPVCNHELHVTTNLDFLEGTFLIFY